MRIALGTILTVLLFAAGCADAASLASLRRALTEEFHENDIGVSLSNGLVVEVTFVREGTAHAPCDTLTALALRIATSVRRNYGGFDTLQMVSVSIAQRWPDDPSRPRSAHLPFRFSRLSLQTGRVAADSLSAIAMCELDRD
jgi:hypothetical protein